MVGFLLKGQADMVTEVSRKMLDKQGGAGRDMECFPKCFSYQILHGDEH